jgi:hypothetical protein
MGVLIVIVLVVVAATFGMAFLGQRIGANMEAPNLGAGTTEQEMRSALSPSVLGALLGIIPFMLFVIVLVWTAVHLPPEHAADSGGGASTSAPH